MRWLSAKSDEGVMSLKEYHYLVYTVKKDYENRISVKVKQKKKQSWDESDITIYSAARLLTAKLKFVTESLNSMLILLKSPTLKLYIIYI